MNLPGAVASGLASDVEYRMHQAVEVRVTSILSEPGIIITLTNTKKWPGLCATRDE